MRDDLTHRVYVLSEITNANDALPTNPSERKDDAWDISQRHPFLLIPLLLQTSILAAWHKPIGGCLHATLA